MKLRFVTPICIAIACGAFSAVALAVNDSGNKAMGGGAGIAGGGGGGIRNTDGNGAGRGNGNAPRDMGGGRLPSNNEPYVKQTIVGPDGKPNGSVSAPVSSPVKEGTQMGNGTVQARPSGTMPVPPGRPPQQYGPAAPAGTGNVYGPPTPVKKP